MGAAWFVVHTQPNAEAKAKRHLVNQGFTIYLPFYRRRVRHARRNEIVASALFPGYLFVRFDPQQDRWRSINGTRGVVRILGEDAAPRSVAELHHRGDQVARGRDRRGQAQPTGIRARPGGAARGRRARRRFGTVRTKARSGPRGDSAVDARPQGARAGAGRRGDRRRLRPAFRPSVPARPRTSARPTAEWRDRAGRRDVRPRRCARPWHRRSRPAAAAAPPAASSAQSRSGPRSQSPSGTRKAHLRPLDQFARDVAVEHLPQQPFARAAADLGRARQPPGEFDHAMVEQRHARFQRHRHAGAVDLGQDVVGQIGHQVEELHALEQRREVARRCARSHRRLVASATPGSDRRPAPIGDQPAVERVVAVARQAPRRACAACRRPARPRPRRQRPQQLRPALGRQRRRARAPAPARSGRGSSASDCARPRRADGSGCSRRTARRRRRRTAPPSRAGASCAETR